jgi:deazaflavin-dependent oxidoreductase (nitroreductase family)
MHNENIIKEFRDNAGKVGGHFANMNLLLITIKGAKSGKPYTYPLAYTKDGDNFVIAASKGGADHHPDWYHNLVANPHATVEVGTDKFEVEATEAKGEERDRLYAQHATAYPQFWDYEKKTSRKIPAFSLAKV